jgi:hypothetical protein
VPPFAVTELVDDGVIEVVIFEVGEAVSEVAEIKADDVANGEPNTEGVNSAERVVPRATMVRGSDGARVEALEFSGTVGTVRDPVGAVTDFADPGVDAVELEYGPMRDPVGAVTDIADPRVNPVVDAVELGYVARVE